MEDHSGSQATYLWVAETVLRQHGRPLTAKQIVSFGIDSGFFNDKELSRTPQKSMQARLSTEILHRKEQSRFLRTERGKFFLRQLLQEHPASTAEMQEYTAVRRAPLEPAEQVLVVPRSAYAKVLDFQGLRTDYRPILRRLIQPSLSYLPRTDAETNSNFKQFVTYTIIQQRDRVLSFRRGQYNRAASFLRGARCIGFGGHVTAEDLNLFTFEDRGIKANAAREISEEVRLRAGRPEIDQSDLEVLGVINDDSSDVGVRHVAIVLRYWAPSTDAWARPMRGEASVTQLRWLNTSEAEIDLLEFEYWSQLTLRTFYPAFVTNKPSYRIVRPQHFRDPHLLCVTGSIGSGKSITTERLCRSAGYYPVNTGAVMAKLLGIPPVPNTPRLKFQALAYEFIRQPHGPKQLASAIIEVVRQTGSPRIIIDGLRQLETLEWVKRLSDRKVATLFVHTPPDIAYKLYMLREAEITDLSLSGFMAMYNAPVEAEVRYMIEQADAVIYNWLGLDDYELIIEKLLRELGLSG